MADLTNIEVKQLVDVDSSTTFDSVFVNDGGAVKQVDKDLVVTPPENSGRLGK